MKEKRIRVSSLVLLLILYLGAYAVLGFQTHNDTGQYIVMHIRREPLYPLWLFLLRSIFGEARYLWIAGFLQCVFNALAVWIYARGMTSLLNGKTRCYFLTLFLAVVPQPMTWASSATRLYLAGDISTESFAYPLFLLAFLSLVKLLIQKGARPLKEKRTWGTYVFVLALCLLRSQMIALIVVWMLIVIARIVRDRKEGGGTEAKRALLAPILLTIVMTALFFPIRSTCVKTYFYALGQGFETHSYAANLALSHFMYAADRADGVRIPDERAFDTDPNYTLREYFYMMYDKMDELQANVRFENGSYSSRVSYMEYYEDPVKFDVVERTLSDTLIDYPYNTRNRMENVASAGLIRALLPIVGGRWFVLYLRYVLRGLIRSAGVVIHPALSAVFLAVLIAGAFLCARAFVKGARKKSIPPAAYLMAVSIVTILGFATSVALVHFCISRYMFYSIPGFYTALFALLWEKKKEEA